MTILHLKCYTESFFLDTVLEQKGKIVEHIHKNFTVPFEESKMVYLTSLIMKHMVAPAKSRSKFQAKLICCITFGSASSACCLLKFTAII